MTLLITFWFRFWTIELVITLLALVLVLYLFVFVLFVTFGLLRHPYAYTNWG